MLEKRQVLFLLDNLGTTWEAPDKKATNGVLRSSTLDGKRWSADLGLLLSDFLVLNGKRRCSAVLNTDSTTLSRTHQANP